MFSDFTEECKVLMFQEKVIFQSSNVMHFFECEVKSSKIFCHFKETFGVSHSRTNHKLLFLDLKKKKEKICYTLYLVSVSKKSMIDVKYQKGITRNTFV